MSKIKTMMDDNLQPKKPAVVHTCMTAQEAYANGIAQTQTTYRQDDTMDTNTDTTTPEPQALDYVKVGFKKLWQHRGDVAMAVAAVAILDIQETIEITRDISAATLLEIRPDLRG